jgi:hypothetical protein
LINSIGGFVLSKYLPLFNSEVIYAISQSANVFSMYKYAFNLIPKKLRKGRSLISSSEIG